MKQLRDEPYSQKEADWAAGLGPGTSAATSNTGTASTKSSSAGETSEDVEMIAGDYGVDSRRKLFESAGRIDDSF